MFRSINLWHFGKLPRQKPISPSESKRANFPATPAFQARFPSLEHVYYSARLSHYLLGRRKTRAAYYDEDREKRVACFSYLFHFTFFAWLCNDPRYIFSTVVHTHSASSETTAGCKTGTPQKTAGCFEAFSCTSYSRTATDTYLLLA